MKRNIVVVVLACLLCAFTAQAAIEKPFSEYVGKVPVGDKIDLAKNKTFRLPYILWGGEVSWFIANGGLKTKPGSIFDKLGLSVELYQQDDLVTQVRDYVSGRSMFLRLEFYQAGIASEVVAQDPRTKMVNILQESFSRGDHLVVNSKAIKKPEDFAGKKIAMMFCGPHNGFWDQLVEMHKIDASRVEIVWCKNITGKDSPQDLLRQGKVHGAFVITPDMLGLCGDISKTGDGAENTLPGAKVFWSTAEMTRAIVDALFVRKDFYDANKEVIGKLVAGYLKATEELLEAKEEYRTKGSKRYMEILKLTQDIFGKAALEDLENATHGLIDDTAFVGYPGNVAWFEEPNNQFGFKAFEQRALDYASSQGYIKVRNGFYPSGLDYTGKQFVGYLKNTAVKREGAFRAEALQKEMNELYGADLDAKRLGYFTIQFPPEGAAFDESVYGVDFQRTYDWMTKNPNAALTFRGHGAPALTLYDLVKAGLANGTLQRPGASGNYKYFFQGKELKLDDTPALIKLIESGAFDGNAEFNPRQTLNAALNLSRIRANACKDGYLSWAKKRNLTVDTTQIQVVAVGIREPLIAKPRNVAEDNQNARVEVAIIRTSAEAKSDKQFDF